MNTLTGKYIFKDVDDNEICLFLYIKLSKEALELSLPGKEIDNDSDYFIAILKTGIDYLGATAFSGIELINMNETLISLESSYNEITHQIDISKEEFDKYSKFAEEKLTALADIENKVSKMQD
jgi:hypothetical protein